MTYSVNGITPSSLDLTKVDPRSWDALIAKTRFPPSINFTSVWYKIATKRLFHNFIILRDDIL